MKKPLKILLIVLGILFAAVAALVVWQWDNLRAVSLSFQHSREDLTQMRTEVRQQAEETVQSIEGVTVRDLTEEEQEALASNRLSRAELIALLTGKDEPTEDTSAEEPAPSEETTQAPVETPVEVSPAPQESTPAVSEPEAPAEPTLEDQLAAYLAEIYVMKSEYTIWLENLYATAIASYTALPEEEQTAAKKYSIGMDCAQQALAKEDECDAKMAELEGQIGALLTQMGRDQSLVEEIHAAYEEEKEITKAYYMGLHS